MKKYVLFCDHCHNLYDEDELKDNEMSTDICPECQHELCELDLWEMAFEYQDIKNENRRLEQENDKLRLQIKNSKRE